VWCLVAGVSAGLAQDVGLLDGSEEQAMTDTFQYALEKNPTNQPSDWVNPDTGHSGAVVPLRTFESAQGQPCREFVTTIIIGGRQEQGYGTACRQPDGSWQIVADDRESAQPPPKEVYVYAPPRAYYSYPSGFYGPSRIFLSFSYVYRSGHSYRGRYYLDGRQFWHRHPLHVRERVFVGPRVHRHYHWRGVWEHRDRGDYRQPDRRRDGDDRGSRGDREDRRWRNPDRDRGGRRR
jgi:surface antigen